MKFNNYYFALFFVFIYNLSNFYANVKLEKDSLRNYNLRIHSNNIFVASRKDFNFWNFKDFSDFLYRFPYAYYFNLGHSGQFSMFSFYGANFFNSQILIDDYSYNSKINNSFNAFYLPLVRVDSIIFINSVKSFLYSEDHSAASILVLNIRSFDTIPRSKFIFYQTAFEENSLAVDFSRMISKNTNFAFYVETRSNESYYQNSQHEIWKAGFEINRKIDNNNNLIFSYSHLRSKSFYYGGVDIDSIKKLNSNASLIYDKVFAPILTPDLASVYLDNYYRIDWKFIDKNFLLTSSLFARNEKNTFSGFKSYDIFLLPNKNTFAAFSYGFKSDLFLKLDNLFYLMKNSLVFDKYSYGLFNKNLQHIISCANLSKSFFKNKLTASAFGKIKYLKNDFFFSAGFDLDYSLNQIFKFYLGFSSANFYLNNFYDKYNISKFSPKIIQKIWELSFRANYNLFNFSLSGYYHLYDKYFSYVSNQYLSLVADTLLNAKFYGFNAQFKYFFSKFIYDMNFNYFSPINSSSAAAKIFSFSGLYYSNYFFNDNFYLKAGIELLFYGKRFFVYPNILSATISNGFYRNETLKNFKNDLNRQLDISKIYNLKSISEDFIFNFVFFGEIQNSAILFFSIENLFDKNYYVVPIFPMPERTLKLGVEWKFLN